MCLYTIQSNIYPPFWNIHCGSFTLLGNRHTNNADTDFSYIRCKIALRTDK